MSNIEKQIEDEIRNIQKVIDDLKEFQDEMNDLQKSLTDADEKEVCEALIKTKLCVKLYQLHIAELKSVLGTGENNVDSTE